MFLRTIKDGPRLKKPNRLKAGDTIAVVSLSSGILGDEGSKHYLSIGKKRLEQFGLKVKFMPHSLYGSDYIKKNPQTRALDLKMAFLDDTVNGILCAIGGNDTFLTLPHLLNDKEFIKAVLDTPKVFIGFSDSTINHLMFYKLGLQTYYGFSFITDFAEMSHEMLPYTKHYFSLLLNTDSRYAITPSKYLYEERTDFSSKSIGVARKRHEDFRGFELISGNCSFGGRLLGGCIDSLYDALTGAVTPNMDKIIAKYSIFPNRKEWKNKVVFLESSQSKLSRTMFAKQLKELKRFGVFNESAGILFGRMQNDNDIDVANTILLDELKDLHIPILTNVNFGHAYPRCFIPYGAQVVVDAGKNRIAIKY